MRVCLHYSIYELIKGKDDEFSTLSAVWGGGIQVENSDGQFHTGTTFKQVRSELTVKLKPPIIVNFK